MFGSLARRSSGDNSETRPTRPPAGIHTAPSAHVDWLFTAGCGPGRHIAAALIGAVWTSCCVLRLALGRRPPLMGKVCAFIPAAQERRRRGGLGPRERCTTRRAEPRRHGDIFRSRVWWTKTFNGQRTPPFRLCLSCFILASPSPSYRPTVATQPLPSCLHLPATVQL